MVIKMLNNIKKDIETIKISEIKSIVEGINGRLDEAED